MARIAPFAGWRYEPGRVEIDRVVAPPYDVIDAEEQEALYARDPHNVVRLILGREHEADDETDNRYSRAAEHLEAWRAGGVFFHDRPALYLLEQEFDFRGEHHVRRGFFGRVLLEDFGKGSIFPHERTLSGPKEDRLRLLRRCRGNLSPVFGLLGDEHGTFHDLLANAAGWEPTCDVTDEDGTVTRLWVLDHDDRIAAICGAAESAPVFIADGHHRYETAISYRNEARGAMEAAGQTPPPLGELPSDWILMACVPVSDPGLVIGPTHRLVHDVADFDAEALLKGCARSFEVEPCAPEALTEALTATKGPPRIGLAIGERSWLLTLENEEAMRRRAPEQPEPWRDLDVSALHLLILEDLLGIDEEKLLRKTNIAYTRDAGEALAAARGDAAVQAAFLMRPTTMEQVRAVSESGEVMPQKSTYFYPKIPSGLVFHLFW